MYNSSSTRSLQLHNGSGSCRNETAHSCLCIILALVTIKSFVSRNMVKRKQANKPGSSADASSTAVAGSSSMAQGAEAASAPRYAVSSKDGYRVPKLLKSPKAYFRSLWDLYEATFAISMLETVSRPRIRSLRTVMLIQAGAITVGEHHATCALSLLYGSYPRLIAVHLSVQTASSSC